MSSKILSIFLLFSLSCGGGEDPIKDNSEIDSEIAGAPASKQSSEAFVWVCHHPESIFHGKQCIDDHEPGDCLVQGDNNKFCWLLEIKECWENKPLPYNEVCNNL